MLKKPQKKEPPPEKNPIKEKEPAKPSEKDTFDKKQPAKPKEPVKEAQSSRRTNSTKVAKSTSAPAPKGESSYRKPAQKNVKPQTKGGLYSETKDVKDGGLRRSLKVGASHKFTVSQLQPLLKLDIGKKFTFMGKEFVMDEKLKKQIQLAVNMMKN